MNCSKHTVHVSYGTFLAVANILGFFFFMVDFSSMIFCVIALLVSLVRLLILFHVCNEMR